MIIQRWAIRVHKWVALIVGIQIVLWIAGGLVMSALSLEIVRGEHNIEDPVELAPLPVSEVLGIAEAARLAELDVLGIESVVLGRWLDRTVYRFNPAEGRVTLVDAVTGERLSPLSEEMAIAVARADYAGDETIAAVEYFEEPTWEYRRAHPAWRVSIDDGEGTRIYVAAHSGRVDARRNDVWRFYDFFWMLHIMDYEARENSHHPLIITASGAALLTVLAGFLLLIIKMARSARTAMARRD